MLYGILAPVKHDVAIIGAGLTGLSLAVALAGAGRRVAVIDARPAAPPLAGGEFDPRIYAISPASVDWLTSIRAWQALDAARIAPVYDMQVAGDGEGGLASSLELSAYRAGIGELCTIVEERELARVLSSAAGFATGIELIRPAVPASLVLETGQAALSLADGRVVEAALVVACDGGNSWAREAAGIDADIADYVQTAIVANFECEQPHRNRALQWFRTEDDGSSSVLAWLPLPGDRIGIVWSLEAGRAQAMLALDPAGFAHRVAEAGAHALGALAPCGERAQFPLRNLRARRLISTRFALAGDAAHVLHPLAGQGLNLGFGDCAALVRALDGARDCGDALRLRSYERERKAALLEMHAVTHGLARLFSFRHPALRALRNVGLNLSGRLPVIPRLIVRGAIR